MISITFDACITFLLDSTIALWNTGCMDQSAQTTNPQPVTPPQNPSSSKHLLTTVVVAVVVAIFASVGTYMVMSSKQNKQSDISNQQPTTAQVSPTQSMQYESPSVTTATSNIPSDWKTYTSQKLGIQFRYPSTWQVSNYEDQHGFVIIAQTAVKIPDATEFTPKPITVGINQCTNTVNNQKFPCEKSVTERATKIKSLLVPTTTTETTYTVSGKQGVQIAGTTKPDQPGGDMYEQETILPLNEYLLVASLYDKSYETIYKQIVSSITYTE